MGNVKFGAGGFHKLTDVRHRSNPPPATKLNNGLVALRPKPLFIVSGWCPFLIHGSKPLNIEHPLPFICTIVQILCTLRLHQSYENFEFLGGALWCNRDQVQISTSIDTRCTHPSIEDVSDRSRSICHYRPIADLGQDARRRSATMWPFILGVAALFGCCCYSPHCGHSWWLNNLDSADYCGAPATLGEQLIKFT